MEQDAEQNALLNAILFSPWACTDPMTCGNVLNFRGLAANGDHAENYESGASQPAVSPVPPCRAQACTHTFRRAWKLRRSEIEVLAQRAESRCLASRKKLVMADTTLFADIKEHKAAMEAGDEVRELLMRFCTTHLKRSPPAHGVRTILAFLDKPCRWHNEQCTLAEYSAYIARDVMAHIDLAAEARVNVPVNSQNDEE